MSAITERFLICDGCGKTWGVDNRHKNINQHRREAKDEGWTRGQMGSDYCDDCSGLKGGFISNMPMATVDKNAPSFLKQKCSFCGWSRENHRNGFCYHYSDEDTDYFHNDKEFQP